MTFTKFDGGWSVVLPRSCQIIGENSIIFVVVVFKMPETIIGSVLNGSLEAAAVLRWLADHPDQV